MLALYIFFLSVAFAQVPTSMSDMFSGYPSTDSDTGGMFSGYPSVEQVTPQFGNVLSANQPTQQGISTPYTSNSMYQGILPQDLFSAFPAGVFSFPAGSGNATGQVNTTTTTSSFSFPTGTTQSQSTGNSFPPWGNVPTYMPPSYASYPYTNGFPTMPYTQYGSPVGYASVPLASAPGNYMPSPVGNSFSQPFNFGSRK